MDFYHIHSSMEKSDEQKSNQNKCVPVDLVMMLAVAVAVYICVKFSTLVFVCVCVRALQRSSYISDVDVDTMFTYI